MGFCTGVLSGSRCGGSEVLETGEMGLRGGGLVLTNAWGSRSVVACDPWSSTVAEGVFDGLWGVWKLYMTPMTSRTLGGKTPVILSMSAKGCTCQSKVIC